MIVICESTLVELWRRQCGRHRRDRDPRPVGALGYLANGPILDDLIEIEKLVLVVLHDETDRRGNTMVRLAGYSGSRLPWGIRWGGAENARFLKNLLLQPMPGARGLRMDTASESLLQLALHLDRDIERHLYYGRRCKRSQIHLPRLWAGFRPADATPLQGDGPELADYCARTGCAAADALLAIRREYFGLVLLPFAWVSSAWQQAVTVFADLERFPLRQVFPISKLPDDLIGFHGAAECDFYHSRFRPTLPPPTSIDEEVAAVVVTV